MPPLYAYTCEKCHAHHEVVQKFSDEPLTTCHLNGCTGELKKEFAPSGSFKLTGAGWTGNNVTRKKT